MLPSVHCWSRFGDQHLQKGWRLRDGHFFLLRDCACDQAPRPSVPSVNPSFSVSNWNMAIPFSCFWCGIHWDFLWCSSLRLRKVLENTSLEVTFWLMWWMRMRRTRRMRRRMTNGVVSMKVSRHRFARRTTASLKHRKRRWNVGNVDAKFRASLPSLPRSGHLNAYDLRDRRKRLGSNVKMLSAAFVFAWIVSKQIWT